MSGSLSALQEHASVAAEAFCQRYVQPPKRSQRCVGAHAQQCESKPLPGSRRKSGTFYRPRDHEASPLFQVVREYFDEFERVYPERYQKAYGYWRPVIRTSLEKFVKCGDLKEGFARVRCPDCRKEFFVAFSCRQRACCPSCDQKRSLMLALRLNGSVFNAVPHRQWVFIPRIQLGPLRAASQCSPHIHVLRVTIPKRLRVYFRYDRTLLGKLCRAAYETLRDVFALEEDGRKGVPAMVGAVQTFGDLMNWHPHIHAVVAEGVFGENGTFTAVTDIRMLQVEEFWRDRVFSLLLETHKIDEATAGSMRTWRHSGFNVDTSVRIMANDREGMSRLVGYISRCPLSLTRMITRTADGRIVYRASHARCWAFPKSGEQTVMEGIPRNHEIFDPLDFLAEVTQHIPNKGEHQIRYYGHYSNKSRGLRQNVLKSALVPRSEQVLTQQQLRFRLTWAALIKLVYEVDPLKCPNCGGTMKIVALIDQSRQPDVVERILRHCNLWREDKQRAPPASPVAATREPSYDPAYFDTICS